MKKNDFYGWQKVFKFTFVQNLKSKSFIISTIIISVIMLAAVLLTALIPVLVNNEGGGSGGSGGNISVDADTEKPVSSLVYLADFSGVTTSADYEALIKDGLKKELVVADSTEKAAEYKSIVENADGGCIYIEISNDDYGTKVVVGTPKNGYVPDAELICSAVASRYKIAEYSHLGLNSEQIEQVMKPVSSEVITLGEEDDEEKSGAEIFISLMVPMLSSLILFVLIFSYGQLVAQSIAQEKTGRVMELLLTSVRPLAIIVGKILAMGALALMQFMIFGISGLGGGLLTAPMAMAINGGEEMPEAFTELGDAVGKAFANISPISVVLVVVIFLAGFIFFSLIAGLFGAGVSRSEDLNSAMQPYAIIGIIGFYLAYFPKMTEMEGEVSNMTIFSCFFPLSSPFALPGAIITGQIDLLPGALATLVLLVCVVLMALLVSRIYEQVIFHTGNRLTIKDILGLAKAGK